MELTTVNSVTTWLSTITEIVTAVFGWVGQAITFVTDNPVILIMLVGIMFTGAAVGLLMRFFRG